jgi:SAM-dependent methyltransferase
MDKAQYALHREIETNHWWFTARKEIILSILLKIAPPEKHLTIVDIGCGTGGMLSELENYYDTIGMDNSSDAVDSAKKSTLKSKIVLSSMPDDLPHRHEDEVRVWLFLDVLEHIKNDESFFAKLSKQINAKDKVIITVPANPIQFSPHDEAFGHYRRYDLTSLCRVWHQLSYNICLLSYYNSRLYWPITVIRLINRIRKKSGGLVGTYFKMTPSWLNNILHKIFSGEAKRLVGMIDQRKGYRREISLIAVLTRNN